MLLQEKTLNYTAEKGKEDAVMSTKSMRILNVAAGVLLIAAGIYCLRDQDVAVLSAGSLLGMFLPLAGIAEIVVFAAASGVMLGSGWLLRDGMLFHSPHCAESTR